MANQSTKKRKPRVFIGSSSKAIKAAEAFAEELSDVADMVLWRDSPEFKPMRSILSGLIKAADKGVSMYDFALFVLTPDDVLRSKGKESSTARSNVIFELGLFLGAFGEERTFAVLQEVKEKSRRVDLPSDLGGIIIPKFVANTGSRLESTVKEAAIPIRAVIKEKQHMPLREKLRGWHGLGWSFVWENKSFRMDIPYESLKQNEHLLKDKKLLLVALERDILQNREENPKIAVSVPRSFPETSQQISLRAPDEHATKNIFSKIGKGKEVEGCLLFIPGSLKVEHCKTINDFLRMKGEIAYIISDVTHSDGKK